MQRVIWFAVYGVRVRARARGRRPHDSAIRARKTRQSGKGSAARHAVRGRERHTMG
ncbi:MAG: hypothetical protein ACJ710_11190 [Ornithinibacter sp.]